MHILTLSPENYSINFTDPLHNVRFEVLIAVLLQIQFGSHPTCWLVNGSWWFKGTVGLLSTGSSSPRIIFFFKMSVLFTILHSITAHKFEFSDSL